MRVVFNLVLQMVVEVVGENRQIVGVFVRTRVVKGYIADLFQPFYLMSVF